MAWKFTFEDGREVKLDELAPTVFDLLAKNDPEATWWTVYMFPGASTDRLWRLYCEAAKIVDADPGPEPVNLAETLQLLDRLERIPDVEEEPMSDGFPPTPDVPVTGSSSGAPGDSDGPQTSQDDSPSETC
jgi:hypothetical protein